MLGCCRHDQLGATAIVYLNLPNDTIPPPHCVRSETVGGKVTKVLSLSSEVLLITLTVVFIAIVL